MLAYHSGIDVLSQDGFRRWQHFIFERVAGSVTGVRNDNALLLGKKERQELDQIQMDSERVLISSDVSSGLTSVPVWSMLQLICINSLTI